MFARLWKFFNQRLLENSLGSGMSVALTLLLLFGLQQLDFFGRFFVHFFLDDAGRVRFLPSAFGFLILALAVSEVLSRLSHRFHWQLFAVDLERSRTLFGVLATLLVVGVVFYGSFQFFGFWWQRFGLFLGAIVAGGLAYFVSAFAGSLFGRVHPRFGLSQENPELDYFLIEFRQGVASVSAAEQERYIKLLTKLDHHMNHRITDKAVENLTDISQMLASCDRMDLAESILYVAGEQLTLRGRFKQALTLYRVSSDLKRGCDSFTPSDTIDDLIKLGMNASFAGDYSVAIETFLAAKQIYLDSDFEEVTTALAIDQGLAQTYVSADRYQEALTLLSEAIEMSAAFGDAVPSHTSAMLNRTLGVVYQKLGDVEKGEALIRDSVEQLMASMDLDSVKITSVEPE